MAPGRGAASPELVDWLRARDTGTFLSVISIAEIEAGVTKLARTGAAAKAKAITSWLEVLIGLHGERILAFDLEAARIAGAIQDRARRAGHAAGFADVAIAAIAERRGLVVLTRNVRHFAPLGIRFHDPFRSLPP